MEILHNFVAFPEYMNFTCPASPYVQGSDIVRRPQNLKLFQIFVAFLEYLNFTRNYVTHMPYLTSATSIFWFLLRRCGSLLTGSVKS